MLDAVVDIGNSRIKFCRCDRNGLVLPVRGFSANERAGWNRVVEEWELDGVKTWAVASTQPAQTKEFLSWVESKGDHAIVLDSANQLPIAAKVDEPGRVGIDRLLNALAARSHSKPEQPAIVICAGSAVTVDLLDEHGDFAGGTIFPGLRLMAMALRDHTAQLPFVDATTEVPDGPPGKNTEAAIHLGIMYAVAGGIDAIVHELASRCSIAPTLFLAGGDMTPRLAGLLQTRHQFSSELRPTLTLEGIFLAASRLP